MCGAEGDSSCILYRISGFLSREKTFENFTFLWQFAKVFSAKNFFQSIRYRASGHGALGYRKFANVFSAKSIFKQFEKVFSRERNPLYAMLCW